MLLKREFKGKKMLIKFLIAFLILCVTGLVAFGGINGYVISKSNKYILEKMAAVSLSEVDCILVLGCAVWNGNTLSPMLEDRVVTALELYKGGASPKLLMSGDHLREDYDEVNNMKQFCVDRGVDADVIFLDHAGLSTYESMYRAKEIFGVKKMIIVTQNFHLYRAIYIARSLGIEAYGVACDIQNYTLPTRTKNTLRESLARIKDFAVCIYKPEPTYLGESIPISGSAKLTDDKEYV